MEKDKDGFYRIQFVVNITSPKLMTESKIAHTIGQAIRRLEEDCYVLIYPLGEDKGESN